MCGRYNLITDAQALVDFFSLSNSLELKPRYNIAPSQAIPAVRQIGKERELALLHWGLIPHWAKDEKVGYRMINARAETVAEKPSFRTAFRQRRCLIPATGFYEWKPVNGGKQPYKDCAPQIFPDRTVALV
jgi:putative SOS response-associated peptidase YedK